MTTLSPTETGWRVTCEEHGLDREVLTPEHAQFLAAVHQQSDHPGAPPPDDSALTGDRPLLPADAARFLLLVRDSDTLAESTQIAVLGLWEALTGLYGDDALTHARELAARPGTVHAYITPF